MVWPGAPVRAVAEPGTLDYWREWTLLDTQTGKTCALPDVTPHQLAIEVAARYGVGVDKVQVSVPTPHWYLSTER